MGLNAALSAAEVTTLLQQALATELIALSQAASLRDEERLSPAGRRLLVRVRALAPLLTEDRRLDHDLERLTRAIDAGLEPLDV
jgi:histidine ammonia-lyase